MVSAVVHLPASLVVAQSPIPRNVAVQGVSGTIWQGDIANLQVESINLGKISWKLDPTSLIKGQLVANVRFGEQSALQARGKGQIAISPSSLEVRQLSVAMPAQSLSPWLQLPIPVGLNGDLSLLIHRYQFDGKLYCQSLQGQLTWSSAAVNILSNVLNLGQANATLGCDAQQIVVSSTQQSDQVSSEFSVKLKTPNRYQVEGWFIANDAMPKAFRDQLSWVGTPDQQNRYPIRENGRW